MAIKDKKDVSVLLEAQLPEFVTSEHPKFKQFIERYYEFMESQQIYFTGFEFNEDRLVFDNTALVDTADVGDKILYEDCVRYFRFIWKHCQFPIQTFLFLQSPSTLRN